MAPIRLEAVAGPAPHATRVHGIVRRDLDLSGQFAIAASPRRDVEALVRVSVRTVAADILELRADTYFDIDAHAPAHEVTLRAAPDELRRVTHRLVDSLIGILTGYTGPFASQLMFVRRRGDTRTVYTLDPDGYGLRRVTDEHVLAGSAALGPDDVLHYSASVNHGRYRLYREGDPQPLLLDPPGSVYGITFSHDRRRVALTIAVGADVRLYSGDADFTELRPVGELGLALHPAFSPRGQLAVAGTNTGRPRIFVDGRPASRKRVTASSPTYCDHPDGTRLVYASGGRRRSRIFVADARGRGAKAITRGGGRHSHPACSPDGRLIAFFSTRTSGEGPGLYVMRIDGYRAHRIARLHGDALRWTRIGSSALPQRD